MKRFRKTLSSLAVSIWLTASTLHAQTPLNEDFETYAETTGSAEFYLNDVSEGAWFLFFNTPDQSVDLALTDSFSSTTVDNKAAYFFDNDVTDAGNLFVNHGVALASGETLTFDFKAAAFNQNPSIKLLDDSNTIGIRLFIPKWNNDLSNFGPGNVQTDVDGEYAIVADTWYRYELTISDLSTASDTYDLRVLIADGGAGTEVINMIGLSFNNDVASIDKIRFETGGNSDAQGTSFYFDNVAVIPAPGPPAPLEIVGFSHIPGIDVGLTWRSQPGATYRIANSTDLSDWAYLGNPITADNDEILGDGEQITVTVLLNDFESEEQMFFRVESEL